MASVTVTDVKSGHLTTDDRTKSVEIEVILSTQEDGELHVTIPYQPLSYLISILLRLSGAAYNAHVKYGNVPAASIPQEEVLQVGASRMTALEDGSVILSIVGRLPGSPPMTLNTRMDQEQVMEGLKDSLDTSKSRSTLQ